MNNRTTIKHVLNNCQISERLRGGLTMYAGFFKVEYLDEVEPTLMRERIINVGKLTEKELIELKNKLK